MSLFIFHFIYVFIFYGLMVRCHFFHVFSTGFLVRVLGALWMTHKCNSPESSDILAKRPFIVSYWCTLKLYKVLNYNTIGGPLM
jgi:hypothetical protein